MASARWCSRLKSRPITGITVPAVTRGYPLLLTPFVALLAAIIFPLPRVQTSHSLPQEEHLRLSDRAVVRLVEAESREPEPWHRDDYRIARITVALARDGSPIPHVEATYRVLGLHPDKVWPSILARRRALLGQKMGAFDRRIPRPISVSGSPLVRRAHKFAA